MGQGHEPGRPGDGAGEGGAVAKAASDGPPLVRSQGCVYRSR
jgi:hypothetical protein